ncbi:OmpP1/FadL family transporter [Lutibaculum baratangense]|nr:porin [Lutibaculum baratangense]
MGIELTSWRFVGAAAILGSVTIFLPGEAEAGGFALREQSAYSQGASFAGAATCGDSIQGMFWNPAVVTCARGFDVEGTASLIMPSAEFTTFPFPDSTFGPGSPLGYVGNPGDVGRDALVPSNAAAFNFNDHLFFGVSVNAGYGLVTKTNVNHAAQIYGRTSDVFSLNAQPTVGYRINDMISVGVGLQIQYFDVRLTQGVAPGPGAPTAILSGDDTGFGATAGILFTPMPGTEIGLGYRSRIEHSLEGSVAVPGLGSFPIATDITLPDIVSLGVRHRFNDRFTLLGTVEWSNWSEFSTFRITGPGSAVVPELPFEYEDGWFYSVGGEYAVNDQLTLRAGIGWEESPVSDEVRTVRLPDNDRLWLSAGASYDVNERLKLNAAYTYLATSDTEVVYAPGNPHYEPGLPLYRADVDADVHIVSLGLKYSFGGAPAAAEPAYAPVYKP